MSEMTEALERIDLCYRFRINKPITSLDEIEIRLSLFPFRLSDEAYEFYQWAGAPTGDRYPDDWDGSYNDSSTYECALECLLEQGTEELVHFISLEEATKCCPCEIYYPNGFPILSYEYGHLIITGSQYHTSTSPVIKVEDSPELWFPSLTNMMLAIAESMETIGTINPGWIERTDDEDYGTEKYNAKVREKCRILKSIAIKYGSPKGDILLC